jgi:hypothetical protein
MTKLRDVLPHEALSEDSVRRHLDTEVIESVGTGYTWPGSQKNVCHWWKLSSGHAVAWNENPSRGWSFPVIKLRS